MRSIAKRTKWIIFALAIISTVACNNSDDVTEIFIGRDWKLTFIEEGGARRWPSQDRVYGLTFAANTFNATTPSGGRIGGRWFADGRTREFRCSNISTQGIVASDTIATRMIEILREASSYDGDIHYLQIKTDKNHLMQFYNR